jgi:hypothetical protein
LHPVENSLWKRYGPVVRHYGVNECIAYECVDKHEIPEVSEGGS